MQTAKETALEIFNTLVAKTTPEVAQELAYLFGPSQSGVDIYNILVGYIIPHQEWLKNIKSHDPQA